MLNRKVAIIDPAAAARFSRKGIDQAGQGSVRQRDLAEQRRFVRVEEAAVVWRQTHIRIAVGNRTEEVCEARPPGRALVRHGSKAIDDRRGLVTHRLQPVLAIAIVADREEVAIFSVKKEKKPEKQA
jgi:hypothetical protein